MSSRATAAAEVEQSDRAKLYILGGAAVIGGVTLGWAAAQGWAEEVPDREPTTAESLGTWAAFNVGLVLTASAYKDAIEEYGIAKVAIVSVAIPAVALTVRALRG